MKKHLFICIAFGVGLSSTVAFARGGMGGMGMSHGMAMSHTMGSGLGSATMSIGAGGAFGTSPYAPGTNSLGTALSSSGTEKAMKGPLLGTSPAIDHEEAKVEKMIGSICRGC